MHRAWHHWLMGLGYRSSIHFCESCEKKFEDGSIEISKPEKEVDRNRFGLKFPNEIENKAREILKGWPPDKKPVYRNFTCDDCKAEMRKAYHVWLNFNGTLVEEHFCKKCGKRIGLDKLE
jgi:hypothetical protein